MTTNRERNLEYANTAEFHPASGKKPVAYQDMPKEQREATAKIAAQARTNKHGADDPFPDGPVVMDGVEVITEDHPSIEGL